MGHSPSQSGHIYCIVCSQLCYFLRHQCMTKLDAKLVEKNTPLAGLSVRLRACLPCAQVSPRYGRVRHETFRHFLCCKNCKSILPSPYCIYCGRPVSIKQLDSMKKCVSCVILRTTHVITTANVSVPSPSMMLGFCEWGFCVSIF